MTKQPSQPLVRFLLVGGLNTLTGLGLIFIAKGFFGVGDVQANAFGYSVGMLVSYALNRSWTFAHRGSAGRSFLLFLVVQGSAYLLNLFCVMGLIRLGVDTYLAQALGVPPYTIVSYLGSRYIAFAPSGRKKIVGAGR